jgi:hypothetical protein
MSDPEAIEPQPADDVIEPPQVETPPKPNGNGEHPETISDQVKSAREAIPVGDHGVAPTAYEHQVTIAKDRSRAYLMLPQHLHNNTAVMAGLVGIAARFNLDPLMLASQTYIQNNRLCFQAQAFGAILYGSKLLIGRLRFEFKGEGEDLTCTVFGRFRDDPDTICGATTPPLKLLHPGYSTKEKDGVKQTFVKGSPLWDKDPEQQLAYFAERRWIRRFAPDACMGMYTAEEVAEIDSFRIGRGDSVPLTTDRVGQLNTGEGWGSGSHLDMDLAAIAPEIPETEPERPARPVQKPKGVARSKTASRVKTHPVKPAAAGKSKPPTKGAVREAADRAEKGPRHQDTAPSKWLNYVTEVENWIKGLDAEHADGADAIWEGEREKRDGLKVPIGERSRLRALLDRQLNKLRQGSML